MWLLKGISRQKVRKQMQIVINIPDEKYDRLLYQDIISLRSYVENGIVLPKGHGRLIDEDAINLKNISPVDGFSVYGATAEDIDLTPTVLEAESEES